MQKAFEFFSASSNKANRVRALQASMHNFEIIRLGFNPTHLKARSLPMREMMYLKKSSAQEAALFEECAAHNHPSPDFLAL